MTALLDVKDLQVSFRQDGQLIPAVRGVSFAVNRGETVALKRLPEGDGRRLQSLDLRYPNGLAARWQEPEEALSQLTRGLELAPGVAGEMLPGFVPNADPNRPPADSGLNLPDRPSVASP